MNPLISVIIPVYNIIEYLPRCVHSVTDQTYSNLEILLVDDGSTDGTDKLCDELATEDARIRIFHKENGGSSSARNFGIAEAKGEYLAFVDSDDYIETTMYERLYEELSKAGAKMAQIGRDEIDAKGNLLPNICEPPEETEFITSEDFLRELLMHRGDCSFCTKLIHRSLFEGRQFPVGKLNEDFHLMIEMLESMEGLVSLSDIGYHVFYRIGSNSRKEDKENFSRVYVDSVENAEWVQHLVKKAYPRLQTVALRFGVFQRLEYLLHIPISQMTYENREYRTIVRWMRRNWFRSMLNPILTAKNKIYHTLFVIAPKGVRKLHKRIRGL